ncbi:MAG: hypothetical protein OXU20_16770 [Myxococcales bacterium]|nr:hypothetical protein [Myxococcales bacterium]
MKATIGKVLGVPRGASSVKERAPVVISAQLDHLAMNADSFGPPTSRFSLTREGPVPCSPNGAWVGGLGLLADIRRAPPSGRL